MKKDYYKQFVIPFSGLKQGVHEYNFLIDNTFFEAYEFKQKVSGADVKLLLSVEKRSTMLVLHFQFDGKVTTACDRCLKDLFVPLRFSERLIVKTSGEDYADTTDEVITLKSSESDIDITHYIYEYLNLALPQRNVHSYEHCDPEILKYLSTEETNEKENHNNPIDPRWEKLKGLN